MFERLDEDAPLLKRLQMYRLPALRLHSSPLRLSERSGVPAGDYLEIGDSGFGANVSLKSPLDSETIEGRAIRFQKGACFQTFRWICRHSLQVRRSLAARPTESSPA